LSGGFGARGEQAADGEGLHLGAFQGVLEGDEGGGGEGFGVLGVGDLGGVAVGGVEQGGDGGEVS
jgi:hypothetical protein